ncbi:MAG TPA: hypothetical protein VN224_10450 [Xanthomonadales bacterium]|nr:hypothetical protein [Xanthomonadales bacterium]
MRAFALLWLACVVVLFARRPDLLSNPQFYAEDGKLFFHDAVLNGLGSLVAPYAGYHQLIPRVVALLALPLPAAAAPAAYAWVSVAIAAACCAVLAPLLRGAIADPGLRALAALGVAAAVPADEIIGSVASLQWYLHLPMLTASLVVLPARAAPVWRIAAMLVGFTTPQGLLAAPAAAFLWWRRRAGFDPWVATSYAGASLLNIITSPPDAEGRATPHLAQAFAAVTAFRVGDAVALGKDGAMALAAHHLAVGVVLGVTLLAVLLAALARRRSPVWAGVFAYLIAAPVALVLATRSFDAAGFTGYTFFGADRYFVAPCAAAVVALAALAATIRRATLARAAAVAALGYGACANFHEPHMLPDDHWRASAPALDVWRADRDGGLAAPAVGASISPPLWYVALPACAPGGRGGPFPRCPGAQ